MISVVILTLNEADNLPRCLASVRWCDDILIVDSGSIDATVTIAEASGARVLTRAFDSFGKQRNFAMEAGAIRHPWVLHLDADEVVTEALAKELQAIVARVAEFPVYRVPSRIIFMGRWLRYSGMYPSYQVRFGQREQLRFIDHGHGQREVQAAHDVGTLSAPLDHYNFSKGEDDWFARHRRYARDEATQALAERRQSLGLAELFHSDRTLRRRALKRLANRLPFRPTARFLYAYVLRRGFLDGRAGLRYARMLATYQRMIDTSLDEQRKALEPKQH